MNRPPQRLPDRAPAPGADGVVALPARPVPAEEVDQIIGRRDIAAVPWAGIALCAAGVAMASALRPPVDGLPDGVVVPIALAHCVVATVIVLLQGTRLMQWMARQLPVYLIGSTTLVALLCVLAALDQGLATVFMAASAQIAMYVGLVLPRRWAIAAIVLQLSLAGVVHAINPAASALDAATVLGLTAAGWLIGLICRRAHRSAARIALVLSRSDVLTRTLNRRGFLEQFEQQLHAASDDREPVALILLDLDDFKQVNDGTGYSAGDALLAWVGGSFPSLVPDDAAVGRLGGDEFGIAVRGIARHEAEELARTIADRIGERISISVGVATSEGGATTSDDFLRVAEAALDQARSHGPGRVQTLIAGSTRHSRDAIDQARTTLTYRELVAAGGPPDRPARSINFGGLARRGLLVIALCGALVVIGVALEGPTDPWGRFVITAGPFWVLANVLGGLFFPATRDVHGNHERAAIAIPAATLGFGLMVSMLADGGLTSPLVAAFAMKLLFDAVVLRRHRPLLGAVPLLAFWLGVVALAPASQLWVVPFHLILFGVSHALGRVGRAAFTDATRTRLRIAHTDTLTGLRNRPGFAQGAGRALIAAKAEDRPYGLLAFDLDGFKAINDAQGHAAGDALLCQVASVAVGLFPTAHSVARLGADEFVLALPLESPEEAEEACERLEDALRPYAQVSAGWSLLLDDGFELESMMQAADRRAFRAKLQHPRGTRPPSEGTGDDPVVAA